MQEARACSVNLSPVGVLVNLEDAAHFLRLVAKQNLVELGRGGIAGYCRGKSICASAVDLAPHLFAESNDQLAGRKADSLGAGRICVRELVDA